MSKRITNKELKKAQHLPFRIPTAKPTEWHCDKSKYNRKREKAIQYS